MNRNVESHFATIPSIELDRSIFNRSSAHKTSLNVGDLVPVYVEEVLPGDSFNITTSKVIRLQTLLTPIMDNIYLDTYWFFVPNRLTWNHWKEFCGENNSSAWIPSVEYQIPSISAPSGGFTTGTIADYMGLPVGRNWSNAAVNRPSALPFRAYALICNEFFRDQNLTDPLNIPLGDANQAGSNGDNYINDVANGGKPFKVAKYHDYFTSCIPSPAKGQPVPLPLGNSAPVVSNGILSLKGVDGSQFGSFTITGGSANPPVYFHDVSGAAHTADTLTYRSGLSVDLSQATGTSINELRLAFQLQKFYEKNARGGTRYIEILKSHFGVTSPDARLQRPEYLGGNRVPLAIHQVTNTAQAEQDFLGDLGAMSVTSDIHQDFEKSFTEHGYLFCLCCIRYDHTYAQGLERFWTRRNFTDFYLPVFSSIGEQPVFDSEVYASEDALENGTVFGYQEAWADYRYKPNRVSGEMRPGIPNTLASWHLADYYTSKPTLSDSWIREDKTIVDRVLSVSSSVSNQAFVDFYFNCIATRCMPMYSVPGLIDHH